jgi:hypothetical protein
MDDDRDTLLAIRSDLRRANDILSGIAEGRGDLRTTEEILGGLVAARDRVRNAWRRAVVACHGMS